MLICALIEGGTGRRLSWERKVDKCHSFGAHTVDPDDSPSILLSSSGRRTPTVYNPRPRVLCRRHLCRGRHFITQNTLKCRPQAKPRVRLPSGFHYSLFSPCQVYRHEAFGGIHPYRAVQAHQRNMVRSPFLRVLVPLVANLVHSLLPSRRHWRTLICVPKMSMELPSRVDQVRVSWRARFADNFAKYSSVGMTGCLGVGSSAAKTLAAALNKPLVGVHHMVCTSSLVFYP